MVVQKIINLLFTLKETKIIMVIYPFILFIAKGRIVIIVLAFLAIIYAIISISVKFIIIIQILLVVQVGQPIEVFHLIKIQHSVAINIHMLMGICF